MTAFSLKDSVVGSLLGTAVGDAVGLPCEALSKRRIQRMYPRLGGPRFFFGRGMMSDDTEHTCLVAQSLIVSAGDVSAFEKNLARRLRFWLLGLPAGIGMATARALIKLWLGFPPRASGVFSAGNAPAMRSALLGVCYGHDLPKLRELIRANTCITHRDPKAEFGALAVALAAHFAASAPDSSPARYLESLRGVAGPQAEELERLVARAAESAMAGHTTDAFASELGLSRGVTGYVYHTVPVAIHAWFRRPHDFREAILEVVRCGGDTDTVAAIVGGIVGAGVGKAGIPAEWLDRLWEWPRTVRWMECLGERLAEVSSQGVPKPALPLAWYALPLRNGFFLAVVLAHGLRRLLPPY